MCTVFFINCLPSSNKFCINIHRYFSIGVILYSNMYDITGPTHHMLYVANEAKPLVELVQGMYQDNRPGIYVSLSSSSCTQFACHIK